MSAISLPRRRLNRAAAVKAAAQAAWGAIGLAALWGAWTGIAQIVSIDALARFRTGGFALGSDIGVEMLGTDFAAYDGSRRIAQAAAKSVLVTRDRSRIHAMDIKDGTIYTKQMGRLRFEAPETTYQLFLRSLTATSGVRLQGRDFNFRAPGFTYDERAQKLTVTGRLQGVLFGGNASAERLTVDLKTGKAKTGPVRWAGLVQDNEGQNPASQAQASRRRWEFSGQDMEIDGDIRVYLQARATDGEVIMKAPRIEHNVKTDVVTATGGVNYWGQEANIKAPKVIVYRRERRVEASGGVAMAIKPESQKGLKEEEIPVLEAIEPSQVKLDGAKGSDQADEDVRSARNLRDYPVALRADEIAYWYKEGERRAVITGKPQARQELDEGRWRRVWGHEANWDGEKDWMVVKSRQGEKDVFLKASTGDDFKASEVEFSTKEDDERLKARQPEGVTFVDDDGAGQTSPPPPPPPAQRQAAPKASRAP